MNNNIYIIQDGETINKTIVEIFKNDLEIGDINLKNDIYFSNFVGLIFNKNNVLVSFPKKFYSSQKLQSFYLPISNNREINNDIQILYKLMKKSVNRNIKNNSGEEILDKDSFPLDSFNYIYEYFLKYGLFFEKNEISNYGNKGKIDWKKTFNKSSIIVNNGNVIYLPLVVKKQNHKYVFLSKCMSYVITLVSDKFKILQKLQKPNLYIKDINWNNSKAIIIKLQNYYQSVFKDREKLLITHLINIFKHKSSNDNSLKLKTKTFELIFEDILLEFLNFNFINMDKDGFIKFSEKKLNITTNFKKEKFYPDFRKKHGRRIEPDFYLEKMGCRYIFDSKYYLKVNELNYKQISYYFLLKNYHKASINTTYNLLLLPTERENNDIQNKKVHFKFNDDYNDNESDFFINEQYINIKFLMLNYINQVEIR